MNHSSSDAASSAPTPDQSSAPNDVSIDMAPDETTSELKSTGISAQELAAKIEAKIEAGEVGKSVQDAAMSTHAARMPSTNYPEPAHAASARATGERLGPVPDALSALAEDILCQSEARIPGGAAHAHLVSEAAAAVGAELGLQTDHLILLSCAGLLHDIGCVDWPAQLLSKPGRWNNDDVARAQHHPVSGASMLSDAGELKGISPWIRQHHERPDGSGYPDNLPAAQLSEEGRMLAVIEVFAACVTLRPFRLPLSPLETIARLKGESLEPDAEARLAMESAISRAASDGSNTVCLPQRPRILASPGEDRFEGAALDPLFVEALLSALERSMPGAPAEWHSWPPEGLAFDSPMMRRALHETFHAIAGSLMASFEAHAGYDAAQKLRRELNERFLGADLPVRFGAGEFHINALQRMPSSEIAELARRAMTIQAERMDALLLPAHAARLRDSAHGGLTPWGQDLAERHGLFDGLALSYSGATASSDRSLAPHAIAHEDAVPQIEPGGGNAVEQARAADD